MTSKTKWAVITKDHTVIVKASRSGVSRSEKDFKAGPDPVPVTHQQLEALLAAGAAEEVEAPEGKGTDKTGAVVDREPGTGSEAGGGGQTDATPIASGPGGEGAAPKAKK